jgi:hypothetical protein
MCESGTYVGALGGSKEKKKKKYSSCISDSYLYIIYYNTYILDIFIPSCHPHIWEIIFFFKKKGGFWGETGRMRSEKAKPD